jgi:hypothetical protein
MQRDGPDETTRRAILKGAAATLGVAATGSTAVNAHIHPGGSDDHPDLEAEYGDPLQANTELVGYHSLGGVGSEHVSGSPEEPHYGGIAELRVHDDLAFVSIFSSRDPTNDRGLAILDVSSYTQATSEAELERAQMTVLSFVRNENPNGAVADVKISDDGKYAFTCEQRVAALFDEQGPMPGTDGHSTSPEGGSLQAVDVSDPGNPEVVGTYDAWALGPHNCHYHTIGGEEYLFAVKGALYATAGIYVVRFDRSTGGFELVNYYTVGGDARQGDSGSVEGGTTAYSHDVVVQDDPITNRPTAYWADWENGVRVLDFSDPEDVEEVAWFDMTPASNAYRRASYGNTDRAPRDHRAAHYASPAPCLIDGKRVLVAGQELIGQTDGPSGFFHLVDADGIYDGSADTASNGSLRALDSWTFATDISYDNYTLSPHNVDITTDGWVTTGNYHLGVRNFEIDSADWTLEERGHYRDSKDVPHDSMANGVSSASPFFWCAEAVNGVVFGSDINTGVYALTQAGLPVGEARPYDVSVSRRDDGTAFTAGQTDQVTLSVDPDGPAVVRDRIPSAFTVVSPGDAVSVEDAGDGTLLTFPEVESPTEFSYFVEVPTETQEGGEYTLGCAQYSRDGGATWRSLAETAQPTVVVGVDTSV